MTNIEAIVNIDGEIQVREYFGANEINVFKSLFRENIPTELFNPSERDDVRFELSKVLTFTPSDTILLVRDKDTGLDLFSKIKQTFTKV